MKTITGIQLGDDLKRLGVRKADCVMLHSSLSSLGWVEGGAETVVEAFFDVMGPEGTLVTPGFTQGAWGKRLAMEDCEANCAQEFCPSKAPSHEGAIPNAALRYPGKVRSCHPTTSWIANGAHAAEVVRDHWRSSTPCGKGNPFEKVVEFDGCIVMLGVGVNTVTLWHYYEDILQVPYMGYYHPKERHLSYCTAGRRIQYEFPGVMQDVVRSSGIMSSGKVGRSTSGLMRAEAFRRFMATIMANASYCLVVRPSDRHCDNLAIDAMQKGSAMLRAWFDGPRELPERIKWPQGNDDDIVREDCPAFAGYHEAGGVQWPICRANDRHPELFRYGGIFNEQGKATCGRCSWHFRFPFKR